MYNEEYGYDFTIEAEYISNISITNIKTVGSSSSSQVYDIKVDFDFNIETEVYTTTTAVINYSITANTMINSSLGAISQENTLTPPGFSGGKNKRVAIGCVPSKSSIKTKVTGGENQCNSYF